MKPLTLVRFRAAVLAAFLLALMPHLGHAQAAVTNTPVFAQAPKPYVATIVNADASTLKTVATGGANGTIIKSLQASNTDSGASYAIQVTVKGNLVCTVNLPTSAGNTTTFLAVSLISPSACPGLPVDAAGNPFIILASGDTLQVNSTTTVTAAKVVSVTAIGADY